MNSPEIDSLQNNSCFPHDMPPSPFFAYRLITSDRALHSLSKEVQVLLQTEFTYKITVGPENMWGPEYYKKELDKSQAERVKFEETLVPGRIKNNL